MGKNFDPIKVGTQDKAYPDKLKIKNNTGPKAEGWGGAYHADVNTGLKMKRLHPDIFEIDFMTQDQACSGGDAEGLPVGGQAVQHVAQSHRHRHYSRQVAEAWLQDLCQRDRASDDRLARPLLPLRHCGQDGPRMREEDTPTPQVEPGEEACDAEC